MLARSLPRRSPQRVVQQLLAVAPPTSGLDTVSPLASMPDTDAVQMDNLISGEGGVTMRGGWFEYATNIGGAASPESVRTVLSHAGAPSTGFSSPLISSLLFAASDNGIWDIESGGDFDVVPPDIALSGSVGAGHMSYAQFTTGFGAQYLIACSETDGAFLFDGIAWMKMDSVGSGPGHITGVDPSQFVQVCVWKKRLLFVRRESGEMWFLDVESVGGTAHLFDFGPQFINGGALLALANWTQDDGAGIDDRLVILSTSGDLVIYSGTDPEDPANFACAGTWYIGQPPVGRRCFTIGGGNVYVLTQFGVVPVSQIVQGGLDNILTSSTDLLVQLRKLQSALNSDFATLLDREGWEVIELPSLALMLLVRPREAQNEYIQYAFQMHNLAWSRVLDIPGQTFARRLSEVYAGTDDGRVLRVFAGTTDGMKLDGSDAHEIRGRITPAFNYLGAPAVKKQMLMCRLQFLTGATPNYSFLMNVDFNVTSQAQAPAVGSAVGSLWNQSFWNQDYWSGGSVSYGKWRSAVGLGFAFSPSIFISSLDSMTLASIEYMFKVGGPL